MVSEVTGLPLHTLRAWERRYGIPSPDRRNDSNRRLYRPNDVERLTWVARAVARGFRPADVIERSPRQIRELLSRGSKVATRPGGAAGGLTASADVGHLVSLLVADEVPRFEEELRSAAILRGARGFVTEVAHPLAVAVGEAWAEGTIAIRQEHLMTECLTTQLRLLLAARHDVAGGPVAVLATLPSEPHTLGIQMAAVYLSLGGVIPCILGADTPASEVADAARALRAAIVGVSVTGAADMRATRRELRALAHALPGRVSLWVGGTAATTACAGIERARAVTSWPSLDDGIRHVRRFRGAPLPLAEPGTRAR